MAGKKNTSQAQKAANAERAKKKETASTKSRTAKNTKVKTANQDFEPAIPKNVIIAIVCIVLFLVFLVTAIKPEGWLLLFIGSVVKGLIGVVGFYFAIPALLYIFFIQIFGTRSRVTMRTVCTILFVLTTGCIAHLAVENGYLSVSVKLIGELYAGGADGTTGGVICGAVAMFARACLGTPISYAFFIVVAIFTLLGAMQITLPSLIRAIRNRPRDDMDELDEDEVNPATVVVNHIANKQIARARQKRERIQLAEQPIFIDETAPQIPQVAQPAQEVAPSAPVRRKTVKTGNARADDMMFQIDGDIGTPVAAASEHVMDEAIFHDVPQIHSEHSADAQVAPPIVRVEEPIPETMPELVLEEIVPEVTLPEPPKQKKTRAPKESATKDSAAKPAKVTAKEAAQSAEEVASEIAEAQAEQQPVYCFPPIDLLNRPSRGGADGTEEMRINSRRLNETLASFKIDAHIINVTRGPSVTRYEVELDKGVRLNKLTSCADDIALSLGASGVRIAAVPDKISIVGIEVPNRAVTTVTLREVIDSDAFNRSKSKSSFAVGKDIGGNCIVGNIRKMPHMLIAGTTGSGKSVCMNSIIISLLYKASPEDVKLIMVDPKMVELGIYNGIPHLLIPVVTDPKKAAGSLQWAVTEMLRRYKLMSDAGVRDLESYNSIVESEEDGAAKLPQVVIIVDELADLMLVAAKEVEDSICRIAQMGRAAGMHLIIATQRPSADVITGLMKANIPSRIAFSVASAMESRIILDTMGAEKLVGKGDMLYAPIGAGKPLRVQGCFVTDSEVEAVASYVKSNYTAEYNQDVLKDIEKNAQQTGKKGTSASDFEPNADELDGDEMLPAAVDVILETGQASVSMLQRRLKLGYARAARIVDEMEEKGIVGPFQGSKPRAILVTKEQWASMRGGSKQMDFDDLQDFDTEDESDE